VKRREDLAAYSLSLRNQFLVNGMFFKLSTDSSNLYGGTQWAMKAANHEIKGLRAYLSCGIQELLIPMAALFDYLGFRVLAFSLLPINRSTLIYGSSNAGKTAKTDPEFEKVMKSAAEKLNLKVHIVAGTRLWSAADIEGHRSVNVSKGSVV
jgi:hypothetical protein